MELPFKDFASHKKWTSGKCFSSLLSQKRSDIILFSFNKSNVRVTALFMGCDLCSCRRRPCAQKSPRHSVKCSAAAMLEFSLVCEQGASCFHFALGPANYVVVLVRINILKHWIPFSNKLLPLGKEGEKQQNVKIFPNSVCELDSVLSLIHDHVSSWNNPRDTTMASIFSQIGNMWFKES